MVDTDIASFLFKDRLPAALFTRLAGHQLALTFVTVGELTKWTFTRTWGEIVGYAERRGRPRPINDSWVAACCLTYGLPLATLNVADFQDFVDHEGLQLVTS